MIDVKNVNELLKYKESLEKDLGYEQINNNIEQRAKNILKGEIYWTDLGQGLGSEQANIRPCLVIQNNVGNSHSPTVIIATITSQLEKAKLPTHVEIEGFGLSKKSVVLLEQLRTVDKRRLKGYIGRVDDAMILKVDNALKISLEINGKSNPLDRIKDEDMKNVIQHFLDVIYSRECTMNTSANKQLYDICNCEREMWLEDFKDYCGDNGLKYYNFYNCSLISKECESKIMVG